MSSNPSLFSPQHVYYYDRLDGSVDVVKSEGFVEGSPYTRHIQYDVMANVKGGWYTPYLPFIDPEKWMSKPSSKD